MSYFGLRSDESIRTHRPARALFFFLLLSQFLLTQSTVASGPFAQDALPLRANLILNSGFENATPEPFSQGVVNGSLEPEFLPQHIHAGQFAMRHLATQSGSYTDPWFGANPVPYFGDTTFRLSTWAKAAAPGTRVRLFLFCLTQGNGVSPGYFSSTLATVGTEWQEIRHTHICPADREVVSVRLDNLDYGNTVWWDDLELVQIPNEIEQPGFESGTLDGTFANVGRGNLQIDGGEAYMGAFSLKHTATGHDSHTLPYTGVNAALTPVGSGDQLTFSTWAKAASNTPVQMRIFCYDGAYGVLGKKKVDFTATTTWQPLTMTHSCPQGAQHAGVRLDNDGGAGSIVWWDEVVFERERENVQFMAPRSARIYASEVYDLGKIEHAADAAEFVFRLPEGATNLEITHVSGPVTASVDTGTDAMVYGAVAIDRPIWIANDAGAGFDIQIEFESSAGTFVFSLTGSLVTPTPSPTPGPLQVNGGRHFTTPAGDAVYLGGAHTWHNFHSFGPRGVLDYSGFLDELEDHNHNLMRLWMWEGQRIGDDGPGANGEVLGDEEISPLPWCREQQQGSGQIECDQRTFIASGKWDLYSGSLSVNNLPSFEEFYPNVRFNTAFFELLRNRVLEARTRGIYVDVMLFQGFSVKKISSLPWDPWPYHPFADGNNWEDIDSNFNMNGDGNEYHSLNLVSPPDNSTEKLITMFQRAYARRVIETLRDLDNVLFEVGNELTTASKNWQYAMINEMRSLGAPHPLGMTAYGQSGPNSDLFGNAQNPSPADWVSPGRKETAMCDGTPPAGEADYSYDPPLNNQGKVVLSDSDHLYCILGTDDRNRFRQWIWKNLTRGVHTMLMSAFEHQVFYSLGDDEFDQGTNPGNSAFKFGYDYLGAARSYAERLDLNEALPVNDANLCGTPYCLRQPGKAYLIYQAVNGAGQNQTFNVVLEPDANGPVTYQIEWFNPRTSLSGAGQTLDDVIAANTFDGGTIDVTNTTSVVFGGSAHPRPAGFCDGGSSTFRCDAVLLLTGTPTEAPEAPINFTGTAVSTDRIALNWEPGASGGEPTGYYVYRGLSSTPTAQPIATVTGLTTIFNDSGLQPSTNYWYQVSAFNAVGEGPRSEQIMVRTHPPDEIVTYDVRLQNPITYAGSVPSGHIFIAELENSGEGTLPDPVTVKWYYSTDLAFGSTDLELCWVRNHATGEMRCSEEEWVTEGEVDIVDGSFNFYGEDLGPDGYILIVADPHNEIDEADETNNVVVVPNFPIPTSHAHSPDLRPTRLLSQLVMNPGDEIDMTITVKNFGEVSAGSSQAIIYLSPENPEGIGPNPEESEMVILAEVAIGPLLAGLTSDTEVENVVIPSSLTEGYWELGVKVDRNDSVVEADEANNFYREIQAIGEVP